MGVPLRADPPHSDGLGWGCCTPTALDKPTDDGHGFTCGATNAKVTDTSVIVLTTPHVVIASTVSDDTPVSIFAQGRRFVTTIGALRTSGRTA